MDPEEIFSPDPHYRLKLLSNSDPEEGLKKVLENDVSTTWFGTAGKEAIFMNLMWPQPRPK